MLAQLPDRAWGATATLSIEQVRTLIGSKSENVGVVREPFASFQCEATPLPNIVRPMGDGVLAVNSAVAATCNPSRRVVVDEYVLDKEAKVYRLKSMSNDLISYLHSHHVKMALVPDVDSPAAPESTPVKAARWGVRQSSNRIMQVAPTAFGFNEQAAQDNSFMQVADKPGEGSGLLTREVLREYASLYHQLTEVHRVNVDLFEHSLEHGTPDACFPNNWFSTHPQGEAAGGVANPTMVLYPMKAPNRQAERRPLVQEVLRSNYSNLYDMTAHEKDGKYFEGTGVLVLDRVNGTAYVNISERAHPELAQEWATKMGYRNLVTFRSSDLRGSAVYHTNVMMAIGTGVAIVCGESVKDAAERNKLMDSLSKTHEVVDISLDQMDALCGNALEVQNEKGLPVMAMSTQAYNAFTDEQRKAIRRHVVDICHAPIDTLERVGGGGVRCTLAELF